jgi:prepilin-type N-terminal cleavage/methylation domain-containing protein
MIKKIKIKSIINNHQGVTLLELMVSIALFALTMVMATGIFQTVINSQRTAVTAANLQDNIRYDLERMNKEIRTARKDTAHSCIPAANVLYYNGGGGDYIQFLNYRGQCVKYYLINRQLYVSYPNSSDPVLQAGLPLTPKEIVVNKLNFRVSDKTLKAQAFVNIRMRISILIKGVPAQQIDIATGLSSRNYQ